MSDYTAEDYWADVDAQYAADAAYWDEQRDYAEEAYNAALMREV